MNANEVQVHSPTEIKEHEEVRKYRLQAVEEKQDMILNKLDRLSEQLQKELYAHDKEFIKLDNRIESLEKRADKIDKMYDNIRILVIAELITLAGAFLLFYFGIK